MRITYFNDIKNILFSNLTTKQTIFKNTFWLGVGTAVNKLLALALIIYAARILGAVEYGKFTFAVAFVSLLMIFSDLGLATIITREFSREKEKKEEFYSLISLKALLTFGSLILILLVSSFVVKEESIRRIVLIMASYLLINGLIGVFYCFFHARQKMEYEAGLEIMQVLLIFGFGIFVLFKFPSAEKLSYAYLFSSLFTFLSVLIFFQFKIFSLKIKWDFSVWKKFLTMSWPLALMGLFGVIYNYTDSVMLGYWNMLAETGWYNAAQKIATASWAPMGLIAASFYPALSKFSKKSEKKFQNAWNHELEIMIMFALPLIAGGIALAPKIIYCLYPPDFSPSILTFQILILTAGIIILYRPFYDAMIILNQQAKMFLITIVGAITNVILNLLLIPKYTLYGAAVATLITNFLILFIIGIFMKKFTFVRFPFLKTLSILLASAFASALMYFIVKQPFLYQINVFLLILFGAIIYFITILGIKKYILIYVQK
ncbi:MAG: hypothetical protein A2175_01135 [Candidatus Nealsonbacteria bacterium RBG_13_42_11]|uniref:Uncharacterized protein n=1 Tax=Candidatus Nealsonbacteria bacterium RBG_13_42_11 TaxID=1801663 RepID=A0A1G2DZA7_9BACT|nr:MAG: hypothetical protein A2175_01135 [Candidatus Nealsonbacteria bacterium RBG_13_42_11]